MSLSVCAGCSTAYAVGLPHCPHCGSPEIRKEGDMPKAHVDQSPTAIDPNTGEPAELVNGAPVISEPVAPEPELDAEPGDAESGAVAEPEPDENAEPEPIEPTPELFDPSEHTVTEVNDYLGSLAKDDDGDAEFERVLEAERAGQNRKGIVG